MSDSIMTDVNVHTKGCDLRVSCETLTTASGRDFALLKVGPVSFYPDRDQLATIRAAIDEYLDPPTLIPDAPDDHWKGRTDAATTLAPICGGAIEPEYYPTPEDWESYRQWSEGIERTRAYYELGLDRNHERID